MHLIIGASGQIGSELAKRLSEIHGKSKVVCIDQKQGNWDGQFYQLDCRDSKGLAEIVERHKIKTIYHLPALLSATAEKNPLLAWDININGLLCTLEVARTYGTQVFSPSSIAVYGASATAKNTPQDEVLQPSSIYGVSKVTGELLANYYFTKYGVDTRGIRFPGLISYLTQPGGGTTDYAVHIYHAALEQGYYDCFLSENSYIDMLYMPDAINGIIQLMEADPAKLKHRNAFNISGMSFSPREQAAVIQKYIPDFKIGYTIDPVRQALADSWPDKLDDNAAREEWGWKPSYDLDQMTVDMLEHLRPRYKKD